MMSDMHRQTPRLSVGIITYNEASIIGTTLTAVSGWADEVLIVDSGSTDATRQICRDHGARVIERPWSGYGDQKNFVIDNCHGEWLLQIDADEVPGPVLRAEIDRVLATPEHDYYLVPFRHWVFGHPVHHCGWDRDWRPRLLRPSAGRWNDATVHEGFDSGGTAGRLSARIDHHSYLHVEQYVEKLNRYTTLEAEAAFRRGQQPRIGRALLRSMYTFGRMYFWKRGFLDDSVGLQIAMFSAWYFFLIDRKLADRCAGRMQERADTKED